MLSALQAYKIYLPMKLHFTTDTYDIRRYASLPVSEASWNKKSAKMKYRLAGLARTLGTPQAVGQFFLANFVAGDKYGGLYAEKADGLYREWQGRQASMAYRFKQDITNLVGLRGTDPHDWWTNPNPKQHPVLFREYWGGRIMPETLVVIEKLYKYRMVLDERLAGDPMWADLSRLICKYHPFVVIDLPTYQGYIQHIVSSEV